VSLIVLWMTGASTLQLHNTDKTLFVCLHTNLERNRAFPPEIGMSAIACVLAVGIRHNPIRPTSNTRFHFQRSMLRMHHEA
jgi:hypothetical protein